LHNISVDFWENATKQEEYLPNEEGHLVEVQSINAPRGKRGMRGKSVDVAKRQTSRWVRLSRYLLTAPPLRPHVPLRPLYDSRRSTERNSQPSYFLLLAAADAAFSQEIRGQNVVYKN